MKSIDENALLVVVRNGRWKSRMGAFANRRRAGLGRRILMGLFAASLVAVLAMPV